MDDQTEDLRSALESAFDAAEDGGSMATSTGGSAEKPDAVAAESDSTTTSTTAQRARDEAGRFSKAQAAEAEHTAAAVAPAGDAANVAANAAASGAKAPSSWRKEAALVWDKIESGAALTPEEIRLFRDEAARREQDFHKGIDAWKGHAQTGSAYEKALAPYQETLRKLGVDGVTAVTELMKADHVLRHAPQTVKVQKLMELAHVYGIDLQQQFNPDTARQEQELFDMREKLRTIQSQNEETNQASLHSELDRFATAPGHEHYEAVRVHMGSLLSGGVAKDLEDAYQQAVFANPTTRAAVLEQHRKQEAEASRLQRARTASGSVRGSSPAAGATTAAPAATVRGAIEAAFDAHS